MNCQISRLRGWVLFTLLICAGSLAFAESVPTENLLDGAWFVGVRDVNGGARQIGTLQISGNTYSYRGISQAEVPVWMSERFSFLEAQTGSVEYEISILPGDQLTNLEDNTTIARLSFSGSDEVFLVRIDKDSEETFFHASISEIQLYEISKSYKECSSEGESQKARNKRERCRFHS